MRLYNSDNKFNRLIFFGFSLYRNPIHVETENKWV